MARLLPPLISEPLPRSFHKYNSVAWATSSSTQKPTMQSNNAEALAETNRTAEQCDCWVLINLYEPFRPSMIAGRNTTGHGGLQNSPFYQHRVLRQHTHVILQHLWYVKHLNAHLKVNSHIHNHKWHWTTHVRCHAHYINHALHNYQPTTLQTSFAHHPSQKVVTTRLFQYEQLPNPEFNELTVNGDTRETSPGDSPPTFKTVEVSMEKTNDTVLDFEDATHKHAAISHPPSECKGQKWRNELE